jgi:hypothetical protein
MKPVVESFPESAEQMTEGFLEKLENLAKALNESIQQCSNTPEQTALLNLDSNIQIDTSAIAMVGSKFNNRNAGIFLKHATKFSSTVIIHVDCVIPNTIRDLQSQLKRDLALLQKSTIVANLLTLTNCLIESYGSVNNYVAINKWKDNICDISKKISALTNITDIISILENTVSLYENSFFSHTEIPAFLEGRASLALSNGYACISRLIMKIAELGHGEKAQSIHEQFKSTEKEITIIYKLHCKTLKKILECFNQIEKDHIEKMRSLKI